METLDKFKDITVVAIYGNGQGDMAIPAIEKTCSELPGSKPLLITNKMFNTRIPQKQIAPLTHITYSQFVMYGLHNFIDTKYALIVQHDGWALNGENWRDEWFDFDFIGGLTHAALSGLTYYTNYMYVGHPNLFIVQNGGFSLRSKAFLEAPTKYGIFAQNLDHELFHNEDIQLCCFMRSYLEEVGMKFATDEEAKLFSFEHLSSIVHKDIDIKKIFGHHSRFRKLVAPKFMEWHLTDFETMQIDKEPEIFRMFENYGYHITKTNG
jgi:hypothetical protein